MSRALIVGMRGNCRPAALGLHADLVEAVLPPRAGLWVRFHSKTWLDEQSTFLVHYTLLLDDHDGAQGQTFEFALEMTRLRVIQGRPVLLPSVSSIFEAGLPVPPACLHCALFLSPPFLLLRRMINGDE